MLPPDAQPAPISPAPASLAELLDAIRQDVNAPEGLDPSAAARFIGVSVSKLHQLNADGWIPAPVELGDRCPRWSRTELKAWLLVGAPSRARWLMLREAAIRRAG